MTEEEKKAIERLSIKATTSSIEAISYPNAIVMKKDIKTVLKLIDKQQKEIEELKEKQIWSEATIEGLKTDFIHKDKIRAKIKELEEEGTKQYWTENVVKMLRQLLEE